MNRRFLLSVAVVFVVLMAIGFFVHGILLGPDYAGMPGLFRPQSEQAGTFPYMLLAHVFMAVGFVWVYIKGKEDRPFAFQGIRYGIAIAVLMTLPTYLIYYAVQPMPGQVVFKQIVFDTAGFVLAGIVVAWLNR